MRYSEFLKKVNIKHNQEEKDLEAVKENGYALEYVKKDIFEAEQD